MHIISPISLNTLPTPHPNTIHRPGPVMSTHPCAICAYPATTKCGGCKQVYYCSKEHQVIVILPPAHLFVREHANVLDYFELSSNSDGRTDRRTDRQTDGQTDGRTDRRTDGRTAK